MVEAVFTVEASAHPARIFHELSAPLLDPFANTSLRIARMPQLKYNCKVLPRAANVESNDCLIDPNSPLKLHSSRFSRFIPTAWQRWRVRVRRMYPQGQEAETFKEKPRMRISGRTLLLSALAAVLSLALGEARVQSQVTILPPDPNSPLSQVGTEAEIEAVLRIQDERDPSRILRLVPDFERTYFDSEYRHLVLRLRWQAIRELEAGPEDIIDAARAALAAQDHFLNNKRGFISNTVAFDLSNQAALYYGSLADAYVALGDGKSALLNGELGLSAVEQAWDLYIQDNEEGAPDFENARGIRDRMELNFLGILVQGYQDGGDPEKVIEYGRRFLEVAPDDLEMLLYVSALMAQRPPRDGSLAEHMAATESYATSALERLREFQDVPNSQKESLLSGAHLTLGLVYAQQGKIGWRRGVSRPGRDARRHPAPDPHHPGERLLCQERVPRRTRRVHPGLGRTR